MKRTISSRLPRPMQLKSLLPMIRIVRVLSASMLLASAAWAQTFSEYRVKAAYLYNFVKLADWPPSALPVAPAPVVFCVFGGDDEFVNVLETTTAGKTVGRNPVSVKAVRSARELRSCQLVFFRAAEPAVVREAVANLNDSGALLVGEQEGFLAGGGMINLFLAEGKVRYQVNSTALDHAHIRYESNFLAMGATDSSLGRILQGTGSRTLALSSTPALPDVARKMNLAGTVQLQVVVRPDGTVKQVRVLGGHPLLAEAAQQAARQWRYRAGPSETTEIVRISFGL